MTHRTVRVIVVLVFVAAAGAAAYQAFARSQSLETRAGGRAALASTAARADLALVELAAAQRGYVAPGQGADFWTEKADGAIATAREALTSLQRDVEGEAAAHAASALARLEDFTASDQRVRDYVGRGQREAAADLIFADGYETLAAARTELASVASLQQAGATALAVRDKQLQLASIGVLGAIGIGALFLLLRAPKGPHPLVTALDAGVDAPAVPAGTTAGSTSHVIADDSIGAALDASLAGLDDLSPVVSEAAAPIEAPARPAAPLAAPSAAHASIPAAADVCVDLARLLDARDLEAVLARASDVLSAAGLIVWMTDDSGQALAPALTHGYGPAVLSRLGRLSTADDNATTAAWRARSAQVVDGALAVPMLTSEGCTGVLAIELKHGRERDGVTQALARIIAAQLASTISPAAAVSRSAASAQ